MDINKVIWNLSSFWGSNIRAANHDHAFLFKTGSVINMTFFICNGIHISVITRKLVYATYSPVKIKSTLSLETKLYF